MQGQNLTQAILVDTFRTVGLESGDRLIVHSSYRSLGGVEGGPETVIDALLEVLGPTGNLMFPTFNYTIPLPDPHYDVVETPCRTGIIPELGRKRPEAFRSLHPTHSVAVIGSQARELTDHHLRGRALGIGSPIDRMMQQGGKILLLGVGHTSNSTIHIAEEHAYIPKPLKGRDLPRVRIRLPVEPPQTIEHQLDTSPSCSAAFEAAALPLRRNGLIRDAWVGGSLLQLMRGRELIDIIVDLLTWKPTSLLCSNPTCVPCATTLAALRKKEFL